MKNTDKKALKVKLLIAITKTLEANKVELKPGKSLDKSIGRIVRKTTQQTAMPVVAKAK